MCTLHIGYKEKYIEKRNKKTCRNGKHSQKAQTTDKPRKDKIYDSGKEKQFKEK